jgi:hypothetical protein
MVLTCSYQYESIVITKKVAWHQIVTRSRNDDAYSYLEVNTPYNIESNHKKNV